jgi:hypothetical protein
VRFRLKQPWPDFLTFYSSTTGAGWIVLSSGTGRDGHFLFHQKPLWPSVGDERRRSLTTAALIFSSRRDKAL